MEPRKKLHLEICSIHPESDTPLLSGNCVVKINGKPVDFPIYKMSLIVDPNDNDNLPKLILEVALDSIKVEDMIIVAQKREK